MSNISRRDFLKTAGVMTLAVAAAGVLAGCEGNAAKPEAPVTGSKAPGELSNIGNLEFSVVNAVRQDNVTYTYENGGVKKKTTDRSFVRVLVSLRNTDTVAGKANFDLGKCYFYINGKQVGLTDLPVNTVANAEKLFGVKKALPALTNASLDPDKNANLYIATYELTKNAVGDYETVDSLEVVYWDLANNNKNMVSYKVPTPLTVVEFSN